MKPGNHPSMRGQGANSCRTVEVLRDKEVGCSSLKPLLSEGALKFNKPRRSEPPPEGGSFNDHKKTL